MGVNRDGGPALSTSMTLLFLPATTPLLLDYEEFH
jgi:hypothetical protein